MRFPIEQNPFLGWRAIRISLEDQPLFRRQT
jgi:phosphoenolpyruvate-protein kinase (PTS system EI component)